VAFDIACAVAADALEVSNEAILAFSLLDVSICFVFLFVVLPDFYGGNFYNLVKLYKCFI